MDGAVARRLFSQFYQIDDEEMDDEIGEEEIDEEMEEGVDDDKME